MVESPNEAVVGASECFVSPLLYDMDFVPFRVCVFPVLDVVQRSDFCNVLRLDAIESSMTAMSPSESCHVSPKQQQIEVLEIGVSWDDLFKRSDRDISAWLTFHFVSYISYWWVAGGSGYRGRCFLVLASIRRPSWYDPRQRHVA